jgi:four helix bundle protein
MQDFKKLIVWQKAFQFIMDTYDKTTGFPVEERYGLTSQTRRAVVSISNNIAEGCGRFTPNDFAHFLQMALGSTTEVENCILICKAFDF